MKKEKYGLTIIISLFVGVIGTLFTLKYCGLLNRTIEVEKSVKTVTVTESDSLSESIDKIYDAVVYIESSKNNNAIGSGSGFVYKVDDKYGYILTNEHVISGSTEVEITNIKGDTAKATILGSDEYSDIAVLRIDKKEVLKVASLGSSKETKLGDTVFTVGSPLGKDYIGSVTKGIISGKDRTITTSSKYVVEVLQVDAALNPGNSGGPLVNINGEVIGINSLKLSQEQIEGMGFAIPIEYVKTIAEKLEKGDTVDRPLLGITMSDIGSAYQLYKYGIRIDSDVEEGAVVVEVSKDSPAEKAKLQKGDVILSIDGVKIKNVAHLRSELYKHQIGDTIKVEYLRNNKINKVNIKLDLKLVDSKN